MRAATAARLRRDVTPVFWAGPLGRGTLTPLLGDRGEVEARLVAPGSTGTDAPLVADVTTVAVPRSGRVLVVSALHLSARAGTASTAAAEAVAAALAATTAPGVVVLAGDCFEMLVGAQVDPALALDAHPALTRAVAAWAARPDRSVVVLPGNHDGALAWDGDAVATVQRRLGATVALAADLDLETGQGPRRVRVEHGHQVDPANAFVDPRDPAETPIGHHVVQDLLPLLGGSVRQGWAQGVELVADPLDVPALVTSRLLYRRLVPALAVAALPAVAAVALGLAAAAGAPLGGAALVALSVAVLVGVAVVGGALFWGGLLRRWLGEVDLDVSALADPGNGAARGRAAALGATGVAAYVTGHTHIPELGVAGGVLYANAGCGGNVLHRRPGRGPLPDAFVAARHVSWVELVAGASLEAALVVGFEEVGPLGRVERAATRPAPPGPVRPAVVARLDRVGVHPPVAAPVLT